MKQEFTINTYIGINDRLLQTNCFLIEDVSRKSFIIYVTMSRHILCAARPTGFITLHLTLAFFNHSKLTRINFQMLPSPCIR